MMMNEEEIIKNEEFRSVRFKDGQTLIDYVLVCIKSKNSSREKLEELHELQRQKFLKVLTDKHGLQIDKRTVKLTTDKEIIYYLLHLPWDVLIDEAERLKLKIPLKKLKAELKANNQISSRNNRILNKQNSNFMRKTLHKFNFKWIFINPHFNNNNVDYELFNKKTHFSSNQTKVNFKNSQRQFIMSEILESVVYSEEKTFLNNIFDKLRTNLDNTNKVRLSKLLKENVFIAAYPLHDGNINYKSKASSQNKNDLVVDRQYLYDEWASLTCLFKWQPLNGIENYFGTKIAFFFAWLGFYTTWLFPMALIGLLFFFFGLLDPIYKDANKLICSKQADLILMCPLCEECTSWHLSDICTTSKLNRLFDNSFTVIFSLLMSFWAIFLLEFWKRHTKKLAHLWGVLNYERDEERLSSHYSLYATKQQKNPITHILEPYFPIYLSMLRRFVGFLVLLIFLLFSFGLHSFTIILRIQMHHLLFLAENLRPLASVASNVSCGFLNLIFIVFVESFYEKIVKKLTKWEMYKTETDYEENLVVKLFAICSFNYYVHVFYVAFLKGRVNINVNGTNLSETCSHTGCHIEVAFYLFVTYAGKQIVKTIKDVLFPKFKKFLKSFKNNNKNPNAINQWENDFELPNYNGLTKQYLQITIQFGFVLLFVAAFPLGPLFAFVFNLVYIRICARELLCDSRRPIMVRKNGIGIWYKLIESITSVAILTNALIIAFSSDFIEKLEYYLLNRKYDGFTNSTLLYSTTMQHGETGGEQQQKCRYFESRWFQDLGNDYMKKYHYYRLIGFKLGFVIVYQNVASWVQKYIELSVPDIPRNLKLKLKETRYQLKENLITKHSNSINQEDIELLNRI